MRYEIFMPELWNILRVCKDKQCDSWDRYYDNATMASYDVSSVNSRTLSTRICNNDQMSLLYIFHLQDHFFPLILDKLKMCIYIHI